MYVEHTASVQWKSVIVLTAGFSIDVLIGDFQLSFCTENTPSAERVSRTFQEDCSLLSRSHTQVWTHTHMEAHQRSTVIEIE